MCCVVTEFAYANTIILFNLGEQWLKNFYLHALHVGDHYSPRFQRIIVK